MRYLLLDRITELSPPARAAGLKAVALSDDVFADHFPGHPLFPGALQVESLAQLGGVLLEATMRARGRDDLHALLIGIDKARFRTAVRPGDRLELIAEGRHATEDGGRIHGVASVDGAVVGDCDLTFAFAKITNPRVIERRREVLNIWLHGQAESP